MTLQRKVCVSFPKHSLLALAASAMLIAGSSTGGEQSKIDILRIGTSGALTMEKTRKEEDAALETLKSFIKDETGFENEILRQKDWRELAEKLSLGELHVGFFQGYEFAWAQEKYPPLKPLALAINVYTYQVAHVVTLQSNRVAGFADLQGQSLAMSESGQLFLRSFLEHLCGVAGKKPEAFFSKIVTSENSEKALDQVIDGVAHATLVDRPALEAYKRRKPVRFKTLKEVIHSDPFPPPLVAYYGKNLDDATLARLRNGLVGANRKEKGETLLSLFRLTGFVTPPSDFDNVLNKTRRIHPPSDSD